MEITQKDWMKFHGRMGKLYGLDPKMLQSARSWAFNVDRTHRNQEATIAKVVEKLKASQAEGRDKPKDYYRKLVRFIRSLDAKTWERITQPVTAENFESYMAAMKGAIK